MSDNWVVQNLQNALDTWNKYLSEIWQLITRRSSVQIRLPQPDKIRCLTKKRSDSGFFCAF